MKVIIKSLTVYRKHNRPPCVSEDCNRCPIYARGTAPDDRYFCGTLKHLVGRTVRDLVLAERAINAWFDGQGKVLHQAESLTRIAQYREQGEKMVYADAKIRNQDRQVRKHRINLSEKDWLVNDYQQGRCPLCEKRLSVDGSHIDHAHDCASRETHRKMAKQEAACRECIRGALHGPCNIALGYVEQNPILWNDVVREYMKRRPFATNPSRIGYGTGR